MAQTKKDVNTTNEVNMDFLRKNLMQRSAAQVLDDLKGEPAFFDNEENAIIAKYVALKTIAKAINDELTNISDDVDEILIEGYYSKGIDRRIARVNGVKIGQVSAVMSQQRYVVNDCDAFCEWLQANGLDDTEIKFDDYCVKELLALLAAHCEEGTYEHMFISRTKANKVFDKGVEELDKGTCAFHGMVVPGITPAAEEYKYSRVSGTDKEQTWRALTMSNKQAIGEFLFGEPEVEDDD